MYWLIAGVCILALAFSLRYGWWQKAVPADRPRILMYHMVSDHKSGAQFNKLRVPPRVFERQVRWLAESGYTFKLMSELVSEESLPDKTVALTFDDGYEDNFIHAHPVLKKYQARATLYLVEQRFDNDWSVNKKSHHDSGELMDEPKLSDQQISQMLASGIWELGGHTATHVNLDKVDRAAKQGEIEDSKKRLEQKFGTRLSSFAYPFGIYSKEDVSLVERYGYDSAVTTEEGIDNSLAEARYQLKRIKISGKDNRLAFLIRMRTGVRG